METVRAAVISRILGRYSMSCVTEKALQDDIEAALRHHQVWYVREMQHGSDRPDFTCGDVALEVKIQGSSASIVRQLHRYALMGNVKEVLLVTSRAVRIPEMLNDKPVHIHNVNLNRL